MMQLTFNSWCVDNINPLNVALQINQLRIELRVGLIVSSNDGIFI